MIKLRHQQPSLWHRGLAEDIRACGNRAWCFWTSCWKMSNFWTRCTKLKGNATRRAAAVAMQTPAESIVAPAVVETYPKLEL